jgi:uncharacterized RmlC-like cupin family protein
MQPEWHQIEPSYKKDSGVWVLHLEDIVLPDGFVSKEQSIISIPPGITAGNHKHPRIELFVGNGEGLVFSWLDEEGKAHEQRMNPDGTLFLFIVPATLPHAISNRGNTIATVLELASDVQHDVEKVEVVA